MNEINANIIATEKALEAAAEGFKQMQIALLVLCALCTIAIGLISVKLYQQN